MSEWLDAKMQERKKERKNEHGQSHMGRESQRIIGKAQTKAYRSLFVPSVQKGPEGFGCEYPLKLIVN